MPSGVDRSLRLLTDSGEREQIPRRENRLLSIKDNAEARSSASSDVRLSRNFSVNHRVI